MNNFPQDGAGGFTARRMLPAVVLIVIGGIFLLNNLHIIPARDIFDYWPVALILGGIFKLVDASTSRGRLIGGNLVVIGVVWLGENLGLLPFDAGQLWPLILIGAGIFMLINRAMPATPSQLKGEAGYPRDFALFGGGKRKIVTENFLGGNFDAVFGGFEIDLRKAGMIAESAVLEINAVFGGAEVKIPETWSVVMQGAGVFGAFNDSTHQPNRGPGVKTLYVKGAAVFGGVEIKN